jgi:hypothetical protein
METGIKKIMFVCQRVDANPAVVKTLKLVFISSRDGVSLK